MASINQSQKMPENIEREIQSPPEPILPYKIKNRAGRHAPG
jgi:hypothetical protein